MQKIRISLDIINPSKSHNIGIELRLDQTKFFDSTISPGTHHVIHEFDEDEAEHSLFIIMKGKTHADTRIDEQGNIVEDSIIDVRNIFIDDINIDQMISDLGQYIHDNNGQNKSPEPHKFYGHLGCNGRVEMKFSCPIYLWLLENM